MKNNETQYGISEHGVIFYIKDLNSVIDKGSSCGLFHPINGYPLQACGLNSQIDSYFRKDVKTRKASIKTVVNNDSLHDFVIDVFQRIKRLDIEGFSSNLTNYHKEQRLSVQAVGKEIQPYTADVYFEECFIEVFVSHNMSDETSVRKWLFYEGIKNRSVVTVTYTDEEKIGGLQYIEYISMSDEDVIADIISRCEIQKPYKEEVYKTFSDKAKREEAEHLEVINEMEEAHLNAIKELESKNTPQNVDFNQASNGLFFDGYIQSQNGVNSLDFKVINGEFHYNVNIYPNLKVMPRLKNVSKKVRVYFDLKYNKPNIWRFEIL